MRFRPTTAPKETNKKPILIDQYEPSRFAATIPRPPTQSGNTNSGRSSAAAPRPPSQQQPLGSIRASARPSSGGTGSIASSSSTGGAGRISAARLDDLIVASAPVRRPPPEPVVVDELKELPWWKRAVLDQPFRRAFTAAISSAQRLLEEHTDASAAGAWDLPQTDRGSHVRLSASASGTSPRRSASARTQQQQQLSARSVAPPAGAQTDGNVRHITRSLSSAPSSVSARRPLGASRPGTSTGGAATTSTSVPASPSSSNINKTAAFSRNTASELALLQSFTKKLDVALARGDWLPYSATNRAPGDGPTYRWLGDFPPAGFHVAFAPDMCNINGFEPPTQPSFDTIGTTEVPASVAAFATRPAYPLLGGVVTPRAATMCVYLVADSVLGRQKNAPKIIAPLPPSFGGGGSSSAASPAGSPLLPQDDGSSNNSRKQPQHDDNKIILPGSSGAVVYKTSENGVRFLLCDRDDMKSVVRTGRPPASDDDDDDDDEHDDENLLLSASEEDIKRRLRAKKRRQDEKLKNKKKKKLPYCIPIVDEETAEEQRKEQKIEKKKMLMSHFMEDEARKDGKSSKKSRRRRSSAVTGGGGDGNNADASDSGDDEDDRDGVDEDDEDDFSDDGLGGTDVEKRLRHRARRDAAKRRKDPFFDLAPVGSVGFSFGAPKFIAFLWPSHRLVRFRLLSAALLKLAQDERRPALAAGFDTPSDPMASYLRRDLSDNRIEFLFSSDPCRESVQKIFEKLPKDAHNRLVQKSFINFTLDLYNLFMPQYSDKNNFVLAEAEWAARGVQDETLDFLLFFWFFFDFPLFLMRDCFIREVDYVDFWEFTYAQLYGNDRETLSLSASADVPQHEQSMSRLAMSASFSPTARSKAGTAAEEAAAAAAKAAAATTRYQGVDFDDVMALRSIEDSLRGKVPPSRLANRSRLELELRKSRAKNHERRAQLIVQQQLKEALAASAGAHERRKQKQLQEDDEREERESQPQQQQQQPQNQSPVVPAQPESPPQQQEQHSAYRKQREADVKQLVSFRDYLFKFDDRGAKREEEHVSPVSDGRGGGGDNDDDDGASSSAVDAFDARRQHHHHQHKSHHQPQQQQRSDGDGDGEQQDDDELASPSGYVTAEMLLADDPDAPENNIEALVDFVDDMSDSDLEETDARGRLVIFDRFRLSREIRRRRDDRNDTAEAPPTRLLARSAALDLEREKEVARADLEMMKRRTGDYVEDEDEHDGEQEDVQFCADGAGPPSLRELLHHAAEEEDMQQDEDDDLASAARRRRRVARMLAVRRRERSRLQELAQTSTQLRKVNRYSLFGAPMLKVPGSATGAEELSRNPRQSIKPTLDTGRRFQRHDDDRQRPGTTTELALPMMGGDAMPKIDGRRSYSASGATGSHVRAAMLHSGFNMDLGENIERWKLREKRSGTLTSSKSLHFGDTFAGCSERQQRQQQEEDFHHEDDANKLARLLAEARDEQQRHEQEDAAQDQHHNERQLVVADSKFVESSNNNRGDLPETVSNNADDDDDEDAIALLLLQQRLMEDDDEAAARSKLQQDKKKQRPRLRVGDSHLGDMLADQRLPQPVILPRTSTMDTRLLSRQESIRNQKRQRQLFEFPGHPTVADRVRSQSNRSTLFLASHGRQEMSDGSREQHPDMQFARWLTALGRNAAQSPSRKPFM